MRWPRGFICDALLIALKHWPLTTRASRRQLACFVVVVLGLSDWELSHQLPKVPKLRNVAWLALAVPEEASALRDAILLMVACHPGAEEMPEDRELLANVIVDVSLTIHSFLKEKLVDDEAKDFDPDELLKRIFVDLGMTRERARGLLSYADKRVKRGSVK